MRELTLHQLHEIVGGKLRLATLGPRDGEWTHLPRFCCDSRQLQPGEVFVALRGKRCDGGAFTEAAFARGATGVIAQKYVQPWPGCWSLEVEDSREALYQLAQWCRDEFRGRLVSVAGVAGTATTRRLVDTVLASQFLGCSWPQKNSRRESVALGLLGLESHHYYGVFDLNLSTPGDFSAVMSECRPCVGVVTDVSRPSPAKLSSSTLHDAVSQVLAQLPVDGHAVLNGDDATIRAAAAYCRANIIWVGEGVDCDLVATRVLSTEGRVRFEVDGQPFHVAAWGRHQLPSILGAIGVGRVFGMTLEEIARALQAFDPPPQKFESLNGELVGAVSAEPAIASTPTILKFQAVQPSGEIIARCVKKVVGRVFRFDAPHQLRLKAA